MNNKKDIKKEAKKIYDDVKDESNIFTKKEKSDGKLMAVLCYLGLLILIPFFQEKKNAFVMYHFKEGLNLLIIEIICSLIVGSINIMFGPFLALATKILSFVVELVLFSLTIIGILNALNGKARELPIINKFKIFK